MISGKDIVCFANDWDGDPLSKKHIMLRLAAKNRVLWVNSLGLRNPQTSARDLSRMFRKVRQYAGGCRRVSENICVFSPLAIPLYASRTAQKINSQWLARDLRRVCRKLGFHRPITWSFIPSSADVVGCLDEEFIIYHCVDEFSEFTGTAKAAMMQMERRLIAKSDLVIVSSEKLHEDKRPYHPRTFLVRHGVDLDHFRKACDPQTAIPADIAALPKPVIGFFGLVADWVDLELIRFLASARPNWSFVLIGKQDTTTDPLLGMGNVRLLGRKSYELLPAYCKAFSVATLPFALNELTQAANPLKLREYLAAGLPVVATAIREAKSLSPFIRIGNSYEHFLEQIETLLSEGCCGPQPHISDSVSGESWDAKVSEMIGIIDNIRPVSDAA